MLRGAGVDDVISTNTFVPHPPTHPPTPSFLLSAPQLPVCLLALAIWIHDVMLGLGTEDQWVPPSGTSRSIMSLSGRRGFKQREERGCCNWNGAACSSAVCVSYRNWCGIIVYVAMFDQCLCKNPSAVCLWRRYCIDVCVLMCVCSCIHFIPLCCLRKGHYHDLQRLWLIQKWSSTSEIKFY